MSTGPTSIGPTSTAGTPTPATSTGGTSPTVTSTPATSTAGTSTAATSIGIDELARALGALRVAELRWSEALGEWMRAEGDPYVKVALAISCERRAAHGELIQQRIPTHASAVPTSPPDPSPDRSTMAIPEPGDTAARLAALGRDGLPPLLAAYRALLARTDARVDGPTHRLLTLIIADDEEELARLGELTRRTGLSDG